MNFPMPEPLFDRLAPHLPQVPAWGCTVVAGVALLAGTGAVAWQHPWLGGGILLIGFLADGVGQAIARRMAVTVPALLPPGLLLVPFGFALALPERALAAMFLMFSLSILTWFTQKRVRLIHWLVALGLLLGCILPDHFSLLAYLLGIACFTKTGQGVVRRT
ncbi:MAG: hypothetical protein JWP16_1061 [Alphaproteobacteria bacterium]|jgi:hypothetical protein|nr:hypothetical protein [Alphaproteobacteria bacterium]